jgi:hypothetical protein
MIKHYTKFILIAFIFLWKSLGVMAENDAPPGNPTDPDSLSQLRGHCKAQVRLDTNCLTQEITISAYVYWTWTAVLQPVVANWSTGQQAHKISVVPPGTWSWDPAGTTCEEYHWETGTTLDLPFFEGPVDLTAPAAICPGEGFVEIQANLNYYSHFETLTWSPPNPNGDFESYPVSQAGTYGITVTDTYGCTSSDQVTIAEPVIFNPGIAGPVRMCPEGDTAQLSLLTPALYTYFEWENGETTSPITIFEPGTYQVTATDIYGCTGTNSYSVQSGGVDPFSISVSSPTLCPGQSDTLRVLGGFNQYVWSNNASGISNIVQQAGTYTVTVTNSNGCTGTSSTTITPLLPPVIQVVSSPLCPGDTAVLSVAGGSFPQYLWSSGQTSQSVQVVQPGIYAVTVSGPGICSAVSTDTMAFAATPVATIAPPGVLNCLVNQTSINADSSSAGPGFSFQWFTPDGHFVSGDSTLHPVADAPGSYFLSIRNDSTGCIAGDTIQLSQDIVPPPADAGLPDSLTCSLIQVNIGPLPSPGDPDLLPSWFTSDGNILSGQNGWSPEINQPGTYLLTVTQAINGCTSTSSVTIGEDILSPDAQIETPPIITCLQGIVPLDGSASSSGSSFQYQWSTSDGLLNGPTNTSISSAASVGTYQLQVTNTANGCTGTAVVTVSADVNIPVVTALPPDTLSCNINAVIIDASSSSSGPGYQYQWSTVNGNILNGQTGLTPQVDAPGAYLLTLVNTLNNCTATLAVNVPENTIPPLSDAGIAQTLNCTQPTTVLDGSGSSTGSAYLYQWSSTDGTIVSGEQTLNPLVNQSGTYQLLVTDQRNGCTAVSSVNILQDANAPSVVIAQPQILNCQLVQTILDGSSSTNTGNLVYQWTGNIVSGQGTLQAVVDQPGVFQLTITNLDNGCTDQETITVSQDIQSPAVNAGPDGIVHCTTPAISLGSSINPSGAGYSIQWSTQGGNILSGGNSPTILVDQAGSYQVLITNTQNGCTASDVAVVSADFTPPTASAGPGTVLTCATNTYQMLGSGSTGSLFTYLWSTLDGNILSGQNTLSPTIDAPGTYQLLVSNTQNGCTATSTAIITENADGPVATIQPPTVLTCLTGSTLLNATGTSTGPEFTYAWSTQNGNISNGANSFTPLITAPGNYQLTVTNLTNLCTQTATVAVLQNIQAPVVDAGTGGLLTCSVTSLGLEANILSSSSPNLNFQWTTTNGQIVSGQQSANPLINAPGDYNLTVTDAANGCTGTNQVTIFQDITPPLVLLESPPQLTCSQSTVTINATACSIGNQYQYQWTSSPGGHFVTLQNPNNPVVDAPGDYTLTITSLINGCSESATVSVNQNIQLPTAEAGASVVLDCDTPTSQLNGTGSSQGGEFLYQWTTLDGQIQTGIGTLNPTIAATGTYSLTVINTLNGCTQTDVVLVTEDMQAPLVLITPPAMLNCIQTSIPLYASGTQLGAAPTINWSASGGGNIVSGSNTLTPTVDAPGLYQMLAVNTLNGCTATMTVTVSEDIQIPAVQIQQPLVLTCSVEQFPLQATTAAQALFSWSTVQGHFVSGVSSLNPVIDLPGIYQLSVTNPVNGCTNNAQVTVAQEQNIPVGLQFLLDPPLCDGTPGAVMVEQVNGGIGPYAYSIDGGQTFQSSETLGGLQPGDYQLAIQDANGCEIAETIQVPEPPVPGVDILPTFQIALGDQQTLSAIVPQTFPVSLIDTVIWTPSDGLTFDGNSIQDLLNPVGAPYRSTYYTVTIYTKEGCKASARTLIQVDRQVDIYAPNVIKPDDPDGDNARFTLFARDESIAIIRNLQVFDRWGSMVFSNQNIRPNDPQAGWDGTDRGEPVNPAVFIWWAKVELIDGREVLIKGDVTVLR